MLEFAVGKKCFSVAVAVKSVRIDPQSLLAKKLFSDQFDENVGVYCWKECGPIVVAEKSVRIQRLLGKKIIRVINFQLCDKNVGILSSWMRPYCCCEVSQLESACEVKQLRLKYFWVAVSSSWVFQLVTCDHRNNSIGTQFAMGKRKNLGKVLQRVRILGRVVETGGPNVEPLPPANPYWEGEIHAVFVLSPHCMEKANFGGSLGFYQVQWFPLVLLASGSACAGPRMSCGVPKPMGLRLSCAMFKRQADLGKPVWAL